MPWRRPRHELLLLELVGIAALLPLYGISAQDQSRLCLTHALLHGRLSSDECLASSVDKARYGDHLYSDKAPGLSALEVPAAAAVRLPAIDHDGGRQTRYAHLSQEFVRAGDVVAEGQVLGKSGNSGRTTGPHLHFEMLVNGRPVDPAIADE